MKKIIFIRHGKAEESTSDLPDLERSLTEKGKKISTIMAHKLKEKEENPGVLISSPANRAFETAVLFADEYKIDPEKIIMYSDLYYKANISSLIQILALAGDETDTVTLFGHNPSFTMMADNLCKEGCDFIPKSGVVSISFKTNTWKEIKRTTGKLEFFLKPEKSL